MTDSNSQLSAAAIDDAARRLVDARTGGPALEGLPDSCRPDSLASGYAIQAALRRRLGGVLGGWKVACTNDRAQALMKTDQPFAGPLLAPMLYPDPATFSGTGFRMRMVEGEFAFRLAKDLPERAEPYSRDEVLDAIGAVHPAMEVADSRYRDWLSVGLPSLVADGAVSGALIYSAGHDDWKNLDLVHTAVRVVVNGETVAEGSGANVLGDPLRSMEWLANHLSGRGEGLRAGDIVTTGSCTGNYQAQPGDEVVADFGALGEVRITFGRTA